MKKQNNSLQAIQWSILIVTMVLINTGCRSADATDSGPRIRAVRVVEAESAGGNGGSIQVSGVVKGRGQVELGFQLGGLVTDVLVEEGMQVAAGQVLARLDSTLYAAQRDQASGAYKQAQAMLSLSQEGARKQEISMAEARVRSATALQTQAQSDFGRMQQLYTEGVIAMQQLDSAETGYKQASEALQATQKQLEIANDGARPQELQAAKGAVIQAGGALSSAQQQLDYTTLHAPADGVIIWRNIEVGMTAVPGLPVFEIANFDELEITAEIPESDFAKLTVGDTAQVRFPALVDYTCFANVTHIAPKAQSDTRGFPVRLTLVEPNRLVVPGLVALVEYEYQALPEGIRIPSRAIVSGSVFVVNGNTANSQSIKVLNDKREFAYVSGLEAGTKIVINGQHYLVDGEQVNIVNALAIEDITQLSSK